MTQNQVSEEEISEAVTDFGEAGEVLPDLAPIGADTAAKSPPASPERLAALEAKVAAVLTRGRAPATLRAYQSDWADFSLWCRSVGVEFLPASPATVAGCVAELADPPEERAPAAVSTITRRLAAIGEGHKVAGHPNPCVDQLVRETMKGIRRTLGVAPRQKKGVSTADVRAAVAPLGERTIEVRDRLILLLGFAGAMRRSELVALDVADGEEVDEGLLVRLGRSKTDQEARGRRVEIVYGTEAETCPVRAWRAWLSASGISAGPVLRRVDRHGHLGSQRLSAQAVGLVVKRHMARLGYSAADFAGHSLRRGHATTASRNGASEHTIMRTTGGHSPQLRGGRGAVQRSCLGLPPAVGQSVGAHLRNGAKVVVTDSLLVSATCSHSDPPPGFAKRDTS